MTAPALAGLLDRLENGWERWEVYDRRKVATWADPAGDCKNGLFSAPRWMGQPEVEQLVQQHNAFPALLSAVREFAELEEGYPLGTDVPVYRLGRVLDRLRAALSAAAGDAT